MNEILYKLKEAYGNSYAANHTNHTERLNKLRHDLLQIIGDLDAQVVDDFVRQSLKNQFKPNHETRTR